MTESDEAAQRAAIKTWIDDWMEKLNARAQELAATGMAPEAALEQATLEIRMQIRRGPPPPIDL